MEVIDADGRWHPPCGDLSVDGQPADPEPGLHEGDADLVKAHDLLQDVRHVVSTSYANVASTTYRFSLLSHEQLPSQGKFHGNRGTRLNYYAVPSGCWARAARAGRPTTHTDLCAGDHRSGNGQKR